MFDMVLESSLDDAIRIGVNVVERGIDRRMSLADLRDMFSIVEDMLMGYGSVSVTGTWEACLRVSGQCKLKA